MASGCKSGKMTGCRFIRWVSVVGRSGLGSCLVLGCLLHVKFGLRQYLKSCIISYSQSK